MTPINLANIQGHLPEIDLFISSISFEHRSFSFLNAIDKSKIKKNWFCYNENEQEFFLENINIATKYDNREFVIFSTDDPVVTAKALFDEFDKLEIQNNVVIDISTFTHEGLLILYKLLDLFKYKIKNLFIVYVGASEYSTNEPLDDDKWLSKGTKTIRSVLGYPGILNPSNKNHLIILFGFESERTAKLIEDFEFDKVSIGIGPEYDSIKKKHYSINRKRHLELLEVYPFAEQFEFSLTDPSSTKEQIVSQINKYEGYNIVIAPLNNKLSTLGIAMAALENPRIQICYVRAHEYNYKGYCKPSDDCYLIKLW